MHSIVRKVLFLSLTPFFFSTSIISAEEHAIVTIELYGSNQKISNLIIRKYRKVLQMYVDLKEKSDEGFNKKRLKNIHQLKVIREKIQLIEDKIKHDIMHEGNFSYVQLSLVRYKNDTAYLTIDVVDKADLQRLSHFNPVPTGNIPDPDHLIRDWTLYENKSIEIQNAGHLQGLLHCPVWHCIWGYKHPALIKYRNKFTEKVPKNADILIDILKNDKNPQKRAAVAYLLAHIKNGNDLVKILIPSIFDVDPVVRNNVMRVIAATTQKIGADTLPIKKIMLATTLPATTDRNKSLYILLTLLKNEKNIKLVQQKMLPALLEMLQQQQPATHLPAWEILKKISRKNFGERDYAAWKIWAARQRG